VLASKGAEVLYDKVRSYVNSIGCTTHGTLDSSKKNTATSINKPVIYDLYCGTGTISLILAPLATKVIGIDSVAEAISAARENAVLNNVDSCDFIIGDVMKVMDNIKEKPDLIILDPPRDGVHPKALKKILAYNVTHIIYISCKPTSLARDLVTFTTAGYNVKRAVAIDMFPATANTEVICLLERP
jgi:tRNA/tmRNA/rRNA uracil-C5-methylase (TrmA/RlmC/RlmD family)